MKRKIIGIMILGALAALCLFVAVACGGKTYGVNYESDYVKLADPGTYVDGGSSMSPIKPGETRVYDVILHNGYDRDTLEVTANGAPVTFTPNTTYNDDVVISDGEQVVGSISLTGGNSDIDVAFTCDGKKFEIGFALAEGASESDPKLREFYIGNSRLDSYIANDSKMVLNYADVKDTFSFDIKGPTQGVYGFQNSFSYGAEVQYYNFLQDGEDLIIPQGKSTDLTEYAVPFFVTDLRKTGKIITVDPRGLLLQTWSVKSMNGSIVTCNESDGWSANTEQEITVSLDRAVWETYQTYVDLSDAVLYINGTAVEMGKNYTYTFNTAERSPAAFFGTDSQNAGLFDDTEYQVRLEGMEISMASGTPFAMVSMSTANESILLSSAELIGGAYDFSDQAVYAAGGQYYFLTDGQPQQATVAFQINTSGAQGVHYELKLKYDADMFVETVLLLPQLEFAADGEYQKAGTTSNGVTWNLFYESSWSTSAADAADKGALFLCFELDAGAKYLVNFN